MVNITIDKSYYNLTAFIQIINMTMDTLKKLKITSHNNK